MCVLRLSEYCACSALDVVVRYGMTLSAKKKIYKENQQDPCVMHL